MFATPLIRAFTALFCIFTISTSFLTASTPSTKGEEEHVLGFVGKYAALAIIEMERSGIPASVKLAQAILEGNAGRSTLAIKGMNHFGIKCHDWTGPSMQVKDDDKDKDGNIIPSCFRKYNTDEESWLNHTDFLMNRKFYVNLFKFSKTDYVNWCHGLEKANYASKKGYGKNLINLIKKYNLDVYDMMSSESLLVHAEESLSQSVVDPTKAKPNTLSAQSKAELIQIAADQTPEQSIREVPSIGVISKVSEYDVYASYFKKFKKGPFEINKSKAIFFSKEISFGEVSEDYGIPMHKLLAYNQVNDSTELVKGTYLYLENKKGKIFTNRKNHLVKDGETIYSISQLYGVKEKYLRKLNLLADDLEVVRGERIALQSTATNRPTTCSPQQKKVELINAVFELSKANNASVMR